MTLNSEICWSLSLKFFPELANEINFTMFNEQNDLNIKSKLKTQLFSTTPSNTFVENFGIFEFEYFMEV